MTEAEFKAKVAPLLKEYPTPERVDAFARIFFEACEHHDADRVTAMCREVLYGQDLKSPTIN